MSGDEDWFERERLHFAAADGDLEQVKELLAAGHPINAFDDISKTPLHYAVESGNLVLVQFLIESGADVNAQDPDPDKIGETPLGEVADSCSPVLARILVEAGADPTIRGWMGNTPLDYAERRTDADGDEVRAVLAAGAIQK